MVKVINNTTVNQEFYPPKISNLRLIKYTYLTIKQLNETSVSTLITIIEYYFTNIDLIYSNHVATLLFL
jgi:hypothetical protein